MRVQLLLIALSYAVVNALPRGGATLEEDLAALLKHTSDVTGYALTLGYVDATGRDFGLGAGQRDPQGFSSIVGGNTTQIDRFLFGSGTKPFTASAIVRLSEKGVITSLDDKASQYIDPVLKDINGSSASLVGMLGERAGRVTVRHLIQMQSGIADFDVPGLDNKVLVQNSCSPWEILEFVQSLKPTVCEADRNGECPCRFQCEPGNCTSYSSTNYVLAGLVLAGATAKSGAGGVPMWQQFNTKVFSDTLGLSQNKAFSNSKFEFAVAGKLHASGLTVAGSSIQYGKTELWEQDASVLGFTCGNCIASAHDAAKFYYQLLGPTPSIVSESSVKMMKEMRTLDSGWAKGGIDYGTGLMIQNMSPKQREEWIIKSRHHTPVPLNMSGSYIGHAGDTYAFQSDNGFFPAYNASISIVVNQDTEPPADFITCQVLQVVATHFGDSVDFGCKILPSEAKYECADSFGQKVCIESLFPDDRHHEPAANMTYQQCSATCKGPAPPTPPPAPPSHGTWKCADLFGKKICAPHGGSITSYEVCKDECH